ncbi:MAG TPA: hypothetical protein VIT38_10760 [Allosphingosinicella sp.]|jgi:hypothetical protein
MLGKNLALLASIALAGAPAFAEPSAQALSIQPEIARAGALVGEDGSDLDGGANWVPAILFAAILVGGVLLATGVIGDNDHDTPASP